MDYLVAGFFPDKAAVGIQEIRHTYDPTAGLIAPHLPILHPVPEHLGSKKVVDHLAHVLSSWIPFEVRFGGLYRTRDHWLFLTLAEGATQIESLRRQVYSGFLEGHWHNGPDVIPHIGLGLFVREGERYDMFSPSASSFDSSAYAVAVERARQLRFEDAELVTELQVLSLPGVVIQWASGERSTLSRSLRVKELARVPLSAAAL